MYRTFCVVRVLVLFYYTHLHTLAHTHTHTHTHTHAQPVTPVGPPAPPSIVDVTAGNAALVVYFATPSSAGGGAILQYTVLAQPGECVFFL
jgi:hypothetical protein